MNISKWKKIEKNGKFRFILFRSLLFSMIPTLVFFIGHYLLGDFYNNSLGYMIGWVVANILFYYLGALGLASILWDALNKKYSENEEVKH